jgi:hypothetical protein
MATTAILPNTPFAVLASMPITVSAGGTRRTLTLPKAIHVAQADTLIAMAIAARKNRVGVNFDRVTSLYNQAVAEILRQKTSGQSLSKGAVSLFHAENLSQKIIKQISSLDPSTQVLLSKVDEARHLVQNAELMFYSYRLEQLDAQAAKIESKIDRRPMLADTLNAEKFQAVVTAWHKMHKEMKLALKPGVPVTSDDLEAFSDGLCSLYKKCDGINNLIDRARLAAAAHKAVQHPRNNLVPATTAA